MRNLLVLTILILLLACSQEDNQMVNSDLITGEWTLEQVTINQIDGDEINNWINTGTTLSLDENKSYYRNYIYGEWVLNKETLSLNPSEVFSSFQQEYEIMKLTENALILHVSMTESEYCCDFGQFESDEMLSITETFIRSK